MFPTSSDFHDPKDDSKENVCQKTTSRDIQGNRLQENKKKIHIVFTLGFST